jgi:hypothetical protein
VNKVGIDALFDKGLRLNFEMNRPGLNLVGIDALFDKGRGKEGSWEARKLRKLGKRGSPSGWF